MKDAMFLNMGKRPARLFEFFEYFNVRIIDWYLFLIKTNNMVSFNLFPVFVVGDNFRPASGV